MKSEQLLWTQRAHIIISAGILLGSLYFGHALLTGSILLGFLIVWVNFGLLKRAVLGGAEKNISKTRLSVLLIGKHLVLMAILGAAILYFNLHPMGLLIGVSTLVMAIILFALKEGLQVR